VGPGGRRASVVVLLVASAALLFFDFGARVLATNDETPVGHAASSQCPRAAAAVPIKAAPERLSRPRQEARPRGRPAA